LYVTVFGKRTFIFYIIVITLNLVILALIIKNDGTNLLTKFKYDYETINDFISMKTLEYKIIKLSIHLLRTSVFIIACIVIIAVDFNIFPRIHGKTMYFGFSLMDMGIYQNIYMISKTYIFKSLFD